MLAIKLTNPIIRGASNNLKAIRHPFFGQLVRANSTSSDPLAKPNEYKSKALSLIDALPGNSIISKTGFVTVGATLSTWLVSKEIYMINEETVIATSFFIVVWYILKNGREPFNAWADSQINLVKNLLEDARREHKDTIQARIGESTQLADIVPVTKDLFAMSKEMAEMQAKIFTLKQQVQVASEIKATLDSWVRHENALREREQKLIANQILSNIEKALKDPKMQASLLKEAIADVQKLTAKK